MAIKGRIVPRCAAHADEWIRRHPEYAAAWLAAKNANEAKAKGPVVPFDSDGARFVEQREHETSALQKAHDDAQDALMKTIVRLRAAFYEANGERPPGDPPRAIGSPLHD